MQYNYKKGSSQVLLVGPYGGLNLGDDAIALSLAAWMKKYGCRVGMTLADFRIGRSLEADQAELYPRQRSLLLGALKQVPQYDAVIIGGGQQLQEPRLPNPIWGHLATVWQFAVAARRHNRRFVLMAVGAEKHYSTFGRMMLKSMLRRCDYISARDEESAQEIRRHTTKEVFRGADLAFTLPISSFSRSPHCDRKRESLVLWVLSNDKVHDLRYLGAVRQTVLALSKQGVVSHFSQSDMQEGYDQELRYRPELRFHNGTRWLENKERALAVLIQQILEADCVVSSRMHVLILAALHGVPFVALNRADKMQALLKVIYYPLKLQTMLNIVSAEWLLGAVRNALTDTAAISRRLLTAASEQRSEAEQDLSRMSSHIISNAATYGQKVKCI